jgi:hypothetical protein
MLYVAQEAPGCNEDVGSGQDTSLIVNLFLEIHMKKTAPDVCVCRIQTDQLMKVPIYFINFGEHGI